MEPVSAQEMITLLGMSCHCTGGRLNWESMHHYGAKEIATSFRTVRNNTIKIAEEIPEDKYGFRAAEVTKTVGEMLTHIAFGTSFNEKINLEEKRSSMEGFDFMAFMGPVMAEQAKPRTKAQIVELLKARGESFAKQVEGVSNEFLAENIAMPAGASPAARSRFDMLLSAKEHEMHHRGQLMLIQRMIGITPHLTRENEARRAAMQAAQAAKR